MQRVTVELKTLYKSTPNGDIGAGKVDLHVQYKRFGIFPIRRVFTLEGKITQGAGYLKEWRLGIPDTVSVQLSTHPTKDTYWTGTYRVEADDRRRPW